MERSLKNANMKPLSHSSYLRLQILCKIFFDVEEKLRVLSDLSVAELRAFIPELLSGVCRCVHVGTFDNFAYFTKKGHRCCMDTQVHFCVNVVQLYIESLCHGNILEEEVINISNIFNSNLSVQPLPLNMRHREHVTCLPPGANLARDVNVKNNSETNSVVEVAQTF